MNHDLKRKNYGALFTVPAKTMSIFNSRPEECYLSWRHIRFEHLLEDSKAWGRQSFVRVPGWEWGNDWVQSQDINSRLTHVPVLSRMISNTRNQEKNFKITFHTSPVTNDSAQLFQWQRSFIKIPSGKFKLKKQQQHSHKWVINCWVLSTSFLIIKLNQATTAFSLISETKTHRIQCNTQTRQNEANRTSYLGKRSSQLRIKFSPELHERHGSERCSAGG